MDRLSTQELLAMKAKGQKIAALTAYDASFSGLLERSGIDIILVGDSLGMVIQGRKSTLPVTINELVYHSQNVVRGCNKPLIIADMPFMSYANIDNAITNAAKLMAEGEAQMVKLEGGSTAIIEIVEQLVTRGIPVCGHLGLLPQSVYQLGGYRVQGRQPQQAKQLIEQAHLLAKAGASLLILECVPAELGKTISKNLDIPVIGIGAGADCDGQILVLYDMLGISSGQLPRFCQNFLVNVDSIEEAVKNYVDAVKSGVFPNLEQQY